MKTYSDFFAPLADVEKDIVSYLRTLVLQTFPDFREKISYGVPYYFNRSRVCFIWPASVCPGPPSGVVLGFCRGYLLSNEHGLLRMDGRKQVALIPFHAVREIDNAVVAGIIEEAIFVDEQYASQEHISKRHTARRPG